MESRTGWARLPAHALVLLFSVMVGPHVGWARAIECVSVDNDGDPGTGNSGGPSVSRDGRYVALWSFSALATPRTSYHANVYLRDRLLGTTELISISPDGLESADGHSYCMMGGCVSDDGRYVAFRSEASNLLSGPTEHYQIYVRDRMLGTTVKASVTNDGTEGDDDSWGARLSPEGRYVVFHTWADNLPDGANGVHLRDLFDGSTERVSLAQDGSSGTGGHPAIDPTGRYVVFDSYDDLVPGDTNGECDVYLRDRQLAATTRLGLSSLGEQGNGMSRYPVISDDGRFVAFESDATNLVDDDTNGFRVVFLHDRNTGQTSRVSVGILGAESNEASNAPFLSGDGSAVVFTSRATNLVLNDTNGRDDIFLHHWGTGETVLLSVSATGEQGDQWSQTQSVNYDGSVVVFGSGATTLVPGVEDGFNIFAVLDEPLAVRWLR